MANQVLYGFMNLKDVFGKRVTEIGVETVDRAIAATVAEHNRQMSAVLSLFTRRTSDFKLRYKTATSARLQPLDAAGRARPIKTAGYYEIAFPLQSGGLAWGADYISRVKMTVAEANNETANLISADARWMRDHVLAALFSNTNWTFADDAHGNLTIKGLANSDTDQYLILSGADAGATDTHYLAQAAAIADGSNPFPTIYSELTEHPENSGEVVVFVPTSNKAAVEALTVFEPIADPNIAYGSGSDRLIGSLNVPLPGSIFGYVSKCWVAEWKALPSDYLVGVTTSGEPVLAMREHPESELQGFNRVAQRDDHPFYESQWLRYAGFGAWNRVGAVVQRVGNGAYAIPTNYTSPMP